MKKGIIIFCGIVCILAFMALTVKCSVDFAEQAEQKTQKEIAQIKIEIKELRELINAIPASVESDIFNEDNVIHHIVKSGENLESIASKYMVLVCQIRQRNSLKQGCIIHPGQKLKIKKVKWPVYVGLASWYGPGFHGKKMANTKIYNQNDVLIAHRHLPLGLRVRITNLNNGKSIVAPVFDRGPYTKVNGKYHREVDLSLGAAKLLDAVEQGIILVKIEPLV